VRAGKFFHRHGIHPAFHGADVFCRLFQGLAASCLVLSGFMIGPFFWQEWKKTFPEWLVQEKAGNPLFAVNRNIAMLWSAYEVVRKWLGNDDLPM
jgi:hypothetical protein